MLILALDTATRQASVALSDENRLWGVSTWHADTNHSVEMFERVQQLFAGLNMSALDGIAVVIGPGSFNGVRVAVATAKTLAFTLQKPLVGFSSLEAAAAQQQYWPGLVCALQEAGRNELYAASFVLEQHVQAGTLTTQPQQVGEYRLLGPQELVRLLQDELLPQVEAKISAQPVLFCGEISPTTRQTLSELLGERALFSTVSHSARHASVLSELARQRMAEGKLSDPLLLEPLYIRHPSITTSARKQPLLGNPTAGSEPVSPRSEREKGALRH
jgi:tRNA threonylcarbamoyladenosine biosynthesis protein TsaB